MQAHVSEQVDEHGKMFLEDSHTLWALLLQAPSSALIKEFLSFGRKGVSGGCGYLDKYA